MAGISSDMIRGGALAIRQPGEHLLVYMDMDVKVARKSGAGVSGGPPTELHTLKTEASLELVTINAPHPQPP